MPLPRLSTAAAVAAAVLTLPATASAAQVLGSPLDGSRGTPEAVGCPSLCTIVQESIDSLAVRSDGGVITSWRAVVSSGSTVRLRVLTRQVGGSYTAVGSGKTVTGDDQVQTVTDHVVIPSGATIGVDVDGTMGGIPTGGQVAGFVPPLADGQSGTEQLSDDELLLQATVEADLDGDGLGDETVDSCVFCTPAPPAGGGGGGGGGGPAPTPPSGGGGEDRGQRYSVGPKALLIGGGKPVVRAYTANGLDDVEGTLSLKVGGKVASKARVWSISGAQDHVDFKVSAKVARALRRGGATAVVTGSPAVESGGTAPVQQRVKVLRGVTAAYDGTYRGAGGLVITVQDGVVMSASKALLVSSTRGSSSMTRTFFLPEEGPVILARNGKVDVRGDWKGESVAFKARFARNGAAKGYLSLWHTVLGFSGGSLTTDQLFGASNWTAKR